MRSAANTFLCLGLMALSGPAAWPDAAPDPDAAYVAKFLEHYPKVEPAPMLADYASAARYDALYLGENLEKVEKALENVTNDQGGLAWGLSYRMMSLNDMYRATGDLKYLRANLLCMTAVMKATDDQRGMKLWTGATVPAWGCEKYASRGRAVFAVHTGIITAPMLDFLILAKEEQAQLFEEPGAYAAVLDTATKALAVHDRQWRDGPGENEGHYIGLDQEEVCENKPLPGNRLSAMGWALWLSWKLTGNETHRGRALALGHYIRNRLTPSPDGAYYWPYWLPIEAVTEPQPRESVTGEDTSHAGLTLALPLVLAVDGQVFTEADGKRLARTVINGIARRGDGILISRITGTTELEPGYLGAPTNWLPLSNYDPETGKRIIAFYLNYKATPSPNELARLLLHAKSAR